MNWIKATDKLSDRKVLIAEAHIYEYSEDDNEYFNISYRHSTATAIRWMDDQGIESWYWDCGSRSLKINPLDLWCEFEEYIPEKKSVSKKIAKIYQDLDQSLLSKGELV